MPKQTLWHLSDSSSNSARAQWVYGAVELEAVVCPRTEDHQRPGRRLTDLTIKIPNRKTDDFVWTWYSECLIQDHVLNLLTTNNFTGFEVKPVQTQSRVTSPRLWELVVTGWAGLARPESGIKLLEHCEECKYSRYSDITRPELLIDERQWDGSDFFLVWPLPKYVFDSDRVAEAVRSENWKGVEISDIKHIRCGHDGFSPGRLSYIMPESRASELGLPLGIY